MKINRALAISGVGGSFWKDFQAIAAGAKGDGFSYEGEPLTAGFKTICQSSEAICFMLVMEDGQIAYGDGTSVAYSALSGRDPVLFAEKYLPVVEKEILPKLGGIDLDSFKELSEEFDDITVNGERLHTGIRYGITQALLDGVAKARKRTMAEIVAFEYGTEIVNKPVPLFAQCSSDWHMMVDKMILRRVPILPHAAINTVDKLVKLEPFIEWTRERISKLANSGYRPILHYDLYGSIGMKFGFDVENTISYLKTLSQAASPYQIRLESPFIMSDRDSQIKQMGTLREALKEKCINVEIVADEWCNSVEDVRMFADEHAADVIQIKAPDMGGINNTIEAILYCKKNGIIPYLGGSCCETEISAKASIHIALATGADEFLIKPGFGVETGYVIARNEMQRVLALIKHK